MVASFACMQMTQGDIKMSWSMPFQIFDLSKKNETRGNCKALMFSAQCRLDLVNHA